MSWVSRADAQTVSPVLPPGLPEETTETPNVEAASENSESSEVTATQQLRERLQRLQQGAREIPALPSGDTSSDLVARFPTLGSPILDVQLARYMAYVESAGTPDILIVGSSRALQGIDPAALSDRLSEAERSDQRHACSRGCAVLRNDGG